MWIDNTGNAKIKGDQREVFDYNIFFEFQKSKINRGHNFTLVKKQSRLDVRKYYFSQRTINVWNKLLTVCVHATSVNVFKNRIDKYLVKETGSSKFMNPGDKLGILIFW